MTKFFPLKIKDVIRETSQAVSLEFDIPENLKQEFAFKAGQYITIKTEVEGKEIRRAYSLCTPPTDETFKVTVKEVKGGMFSVIANNRLQPGDVLEVHPPEGKFVFEPLNDSHPHTYAAFAAGSGITPVLSILKTALEQEKYSRFVLIYGNKTPDDTIFFKELLELQMEHPDRLFVEFVYSQTKEEESHYGRIDESTVNYVLKNRFQGTTFTRFYLCGPEAMINHVTEVLLKNDIEKEKILFELFNTEVEGEVKSDLEGQTEITIILDDEETTFTMPKNTTVLDAALDNGIDAPYSCQGGICSSCVARITEGEAEMEKNSILVDSEIEEGLVLTCQAHPLSSKLKIDYDDV
ncbi:ring-1,2-phenylacetyl-CoA epoxidase subunit PaaE [Salinimicrobium catena]|uniref:Ring-1,2-phenylacetyl-CoA epoxidase subunit PaaE n=1 Tax=Salinimicrobium catena TaxID=390640 RepID=A0A1H5IF52_9FLAO|nr:ferredoxin--NADP reductase [Salinimicrobium catena]SDK77282.1 ring-1,2-phenylacetyl-CoA epoxidase subunit PaaE [Salinimicrobium catena]SEE38822.1 ring-1,2-phenylacetyl-CoA epoxidase subunit PaaE [Salinimicrobium catena]